MTGLVGTTLGKYRIVDFLGRGGMAEVYKAYQASLDRYVALKVLQLRDAGLLDFVGRFEREATAIARLRHPHIVQVFDFDTTGDLYYTVMEYIPGPTLKAELRERQLRGQPFTLPDISCVIGDLAGAIDYAHGRGMVHRDIKPANIMFSADGQVVLTDFGIARILDATSHTATGAMTGTPAYMSPEQGQGRPADARSDIYSLGVVLYELLTGRVPFEADTPMGVIEQHIHATPIPPGRVRHGLSPDVEAVILKALCKSPEDRFQTARALAEGLAAAAGTVPRPSSGVPLLRAADATTRGRGVRRGAVPGTPPRGPVSVLPDELATLTEAGDTVAAGAAPRQCPYRGLFAFRAEDAAVFFGREEFTDRLVEAVKRRPLVAVMGPSGSGKSSVVFAGLLPAIPSTRFRTSALPATTEPGQADFIGVADFRPGVRPFQALASALLPLLEPQMSQTERLVEARKLADALQSGSVGLYDVVEGVLARDSGREGRLLLVADQFEELYTLCPEPEVRRRFLDVLLEALETRRGRPSPALACVLTLRADFLGQALAHRPFADALEPAALILGPMTRQELERAIERPAATQGVSFESGLVDRILDDVGQAPGYLPLLEFALTTLWDRREDHLLSHNAYEAIGRVEGALARYAEDVYQSLGQTERERSRRVFVQMVRPGEGTEDTRRLATRTELGEADWLLAQQLAGMRLLVTDRDSEGQETAEIVHEALIRTWERLRDWLEGDRSFRAWQERLRGVLHQWQASDRDDGALLRGAPLAEAEDWLTRRGGDLSDAERALIGASVALRKRETAEREDQRLRELSAAQKLVTVERQRGEEHRRTAQQLRRLLLVACALAVVAGALAVAASGYNQLAAYNAQVADARRAEAEGQRATAQAISTVAVSQRATAQSVSTAAVGLQATAVAEAGIRATAEADAREQGRLAEQQAHIAFARELAAASLGSVDADPERSLLLAMRAVSETYAIDGTVLPEAENALHRALPAVRILQTLYGHGSVVESAAFSPDGTRLATASDDGLVKIWDAGTYRELATLRGHTDWIWALAWSPDGTRLVTGSRDRTARVWDVASGRPQLTLAGHANDVFGVAFSPDGTHIATASWDQTLKLWDAATGAELLTLRGHTRGVNGVAFSPDGTHLASASYDFTARLWDLSVGGTQVVTYTGHTNQVLAVTFSPDGRRLVTGSTDGTARVWDTASGQQVLTLAGHNQSVASVAYSSDATRVATAGYDGTATVWDSQSGLALYTLSGHTGALTAVAFSPDGARVVTASEDHTAKVWTASPGREWLTLSGHAGRMWSVAYSADGRRLVTTNSDGTAQVWDAAGGKLLMTLSTHAGNVYSAAFSPDGTRLATGGFDGAARVWNLATGDELLELRGHADRVQDVAFAPDGLRIVTAGRDGAVVVWHALSGAELFRLQGHTDAVESVAYSPDGTRIATASWDDTARVWDAATGQPLRVLKGDGNDIHAVAFSPDGARLAIARRDGVTTIWDLSTGLQRLLLSGHTAQVSGVAYKADGKRIATASYDGTVKVWDALTGQELFTLTGHAGEVAGLAYSPDGAYLATASWDGTARVYVTSVQDLVALARARVTRGLTEAECTRYLHLPACPAG